jgi:hypothetical protein
MGSESVGCLRFEVAERPEMGDVERLLQASIAPTPRSAGTSQNRLPPGIPGAGANPEKTKP